MSATIIAPRLETERTVIRLASRHDRDAVLGYYKQNRDRLTPYTPAWPEDFFSKTFWDRQIARNEEEYYSDLSARCFVFTRNEEEVIGNVSLGGIMRNAAQFCYLGYGIDAAYEGKGLMSESVAAVVKFGFEQLNLHRIMANYMPTNERSGNLLKRLGFTVEGYARNYLRINGDWRDHILTSLTNSRWRLTDE